MSRCLPAASIKRGNRRGYTLRQIPLEGTRLRATYDLLMANKGAAINVSLSRAYGPNDGGTAISQLRDFYGLDIRKIKNGQWLLAGEWFGRVYVDYVAERLEAGK